MKFNKEILAVIKDVWRAFPIPYFDVSVAQFAKLRFNPTLNPALEIELWLNFSDSKVCVFLRDAINKQPAIYEVVIPGIYEVNLRNNGLEFISKNGPNLFLKNDGRIRAAEELI